jgi:hypothetical protein
VLDTSILSADSDFDALRREWDELLESSDQQVFFLRWHWVRAWWRCFATPRSQLLLVVCRRPGGQLVGVAPLYVRRRRCYGVVPLREICFLGTGPQRASEHLDIIARRGWEADVGQAVAEALRRRVRGDRIWLWGTPATSTVLPHVRAALGPGAVTTVCDQAYVVDTSRGWDETRQTFRHDVERTFRHLDREAEMHDVRVQSLNQLRRALDDLVRLHGARWTARGHRGAFAYRAFEQLVRAAATDSFLHGRLGLWQIFRGGRCSAALIAFVDFGTAHYFQGGFDPRAPGVGRTLVGVAIRDCVLASGVRRFDLMGGGREAGYKTDWTAQTVEILELECLGSGFRPQLFKLIRDGRERLAHLLTYLPAPAARAVRAAWRRVRPQPA